MRSYFLFSFVFTTLFTVGQSYTTSELNTKAFDLLKNNPDSSLYYSQLALYKSRNDNEILEEIRANSTIALALLEKQEYVQSLQYLKTTDSISKSSGDRLNEAISKMLLASVLSDYSEYSFDSTTVLNARISKYYEQCLPVFLEFEDTTSLIRYHLKKGVHSERNKENKVALEHYLRAYHLARLFNDNWSIALATLNIGSAYYNIDNYDSTIKYSTISLQYTKPESHELYIDNLMNMGASYFQLETPIGDDSAFYFYTKADSVLSKHNLPQKQYQVWYNLAQWHKYVGDPIRGLDYFDKAFDLRTKLISDSKNKAFTIVQEKFHTSELEAERDQTKIRNQRLGLGIAASLLLLLGSLYVIRSARQKHKLAVAQKNIANQKIDNLLQTKEMENLDAMLEGQDNERKRIAADLHDRLGSMLSTVKLHFSSMEEKLTDLQQHNHEQYEKATALLDEATNEVRRISHDLSTGTIAKFGLIPALYELKNTLDSTKRISVNILETGMDERLDMNMEISVYRIIQELVANTLKHAQAKKLDIQLTKMQDSLNIIIQDDGIGFDPAKESEGIGIQNIRQRINKVGGEATFDSTVGKGTTVIINFNV